MTTTMHNTYSYSSGTAWPWRWRHYAPPKLQ